MTQILLSNSPLNTQKERLFSGIWLRWSILTLAEKVICLNIVLFPVWWYVGLANYMPLFLLLGVVAYDWRQYGELNWKRPGWAAICLFAFYVYGFVDDFLLYNDAYFSINVSSGTGVSLNSVIKSTFGFAFPLLIWYIQGKNLKVRLEVVAWAVSVSVVQMLLIWLAVLIFPTLIASSPRTLYAILTGKSGFDEGDSVDGWSNYLVIFYEGRFRFFFAHNQICAAFLGFVGLIALELKNRLWSLSLIGVAIFLLSLTATRSTWLAFPVVLLIYFMLVFARKGNTWLLLSILAIVSFITLSLFPVTNSIANYSTNLAEGVANARAGSTEIRGLVYQETLERIPDKPIFGHKVQGPPAVQGNAVFYVQESQIRVGTHSYILGDLLYQQGLLGLGLFLAAWVMLLKWFYQTSKNRPVSWFPILMFFFLQCFVTSLSPISMNTLLLMMIYRSQQKPVREVYYYG
ncbi:O-antigen ligase family protein [Myxosarcina sp. GI1]|uniref:O-antigen ligase family protein n=1 Tax=Myxosarcina sp. GI1 TaxID=1541065 RepID=UPI00055E5417|nr:O-antigen ligase family protein [Myxosarcina sp. GI1]